MAHTITSDEVVGAAQELGQNQFTRSQLATKLGVKTTALKKGFKDARRNDRVVKVGEDDEGSGLFMLIAK